MTSYVQLICLIVSFLYGILIFYTNKLNNRLMFKKNIFIQVIGNILYINNMALLYICFLYKINNGILHIYFVLFIIVGYLVMSVKKRK